MMTTVNPNENQFLSHTICTRDSSSRVNHSAKVFWDLPVSDILQIVGDVIDHLLSEVFEFWGFHVDLQEDKLLLVSSLVVYEQVNDSSNERFPFLFTYRFTLHFAIHFNDFFS